MNLRATLQDKIGKDRDFKELLSGASWSVIFRMLGMAAGYLFTFVVARRLGASAWGVFSLCLAVVGLAAIFGTLGMDTALLRLVSQYKAHDDYDGVKSIFTKVAFVVIPIAGLVSLLVFVSSPLIAAGIFNKPELAQYFKLASLAIFFVALANIVSQSLRGLRNIREHVFLSLFARQLFPLLIFLGLVGLYAGVETIIGSYIIGMTAILFIGFLLLRKRGRFSQSHLKETMSYRVIFALALPLLLASSTQFFKGWVDTFMLGAMGTSAEVGVYNVVLRLARFVSIPLAAVNAIAAPKFAAYYAKGDVEGLERTVKQSTRLIFSISLPLLALLFLAPGVWLGLLGDEFVAGTTTLRILVLARFISAISGSVGYLLQMTGGQVFYQNVLLAVTILVIVLNYLLIPRLGITGAAISTFIGIAVQNLAFVIYIRRQHGFLSIYIPFLQRSR